MTRDRHTLPEWERNLQYLLERKLLDPELESAVVAGTLSGAPDRNFVETYINQPVRADVLAQLRSGTPFVLPRMLSSGELILGESMKHQVIMILMKWLNEHVLCVANSGSGKTTRIQYLALQLASHIAGMWLIDFRKREFRKLRRPLLRRGINLLIVPARRLRINPLQVPRHVAPMDWAPKAADLLIQALALPSRAGKLLAVTILKLYHAFGVLDGSTRFPCLFDLWYAVARDHEANLPAKQAFLDSLGLVLFSLGPDVLAWRRGWTDELARRHITFEFSDVGEFDRDLLLSSLLIAEFSSRIASGVSNAKLSLCIFCDEAQRLLARNEGSLGGGIADMLGLVRSAGIGLDCSLQSIDRVDPRVLSNTSIKLLGRCGSYSDFQAIGSAMGLSGEQIAWCQWNLKPGTFVAQLGNGPWRQPFIFNVPTIELDDSTSHDREADDGGLDALLRIPVIKAEEFVTWPPKPIVIAPADSPPTSRASLPAPAAAAPAMASPPESTSADLADAHLAFLHAIDRHPGKASSTVARHARLSARKGIEVREFLVARGMVRVRELATGHRGRHALILELTAAGRSLVETTTAKGGAK